MTRHLSWLIPVILFLMFLPFSAQLDIDTSRHFFTDGHWEDNCFIRLFYKRGEYPGLLLGGIATLIYLSTFITSRFERWRKATLTITLVFFIGPGLLINGVFKETWGRPRPRTIEQFGGTSTFKPFYKPDFSKEGYNNKSFPSGHVAMAFMFLTVALVAKRERVMWLCYASFIFACAFGVALAYVRIAQGGHYLSDTIISALLMWLLSVACCRFVYGPKK